MSSPWGKIDSVTKINKGLSFVTTPGHGGYRVSAGVAKGMSVNAKGMGGIKIGNYWYFEEDCAYAFVDLELVGLFKDLTEEQKANKILIAQATISRWYPDYFKS